MKRRQRYRSAVERYMLLCQYLVALSLDCPWDERVAQRAAARELLRWGLPRISGGAGNSYQETDTASSCSPVVFCKGGTLGVVSGFKAVLNGTAGTAHTSSTTAGQTDTALSPMFEIAPLSTDTVGAGNWVVRLNVTTAQANWTWVSCWVCQVSSACANKATIGNLTGQSISLGSTGVKSMTISGSAVTLASGDVVEIVLGFQVAGGMGTSYGFTLDQLIDTPITAAGGAPFEAVGALGFLEGRGVRGVPYRYVQPRSTDEQRPTPLVPQTDDPFSDWLRPGRGLLAGPNRYVAPRQSDERRPTPAIAAADEAIPFQRLGWRRLVLSAPSEAGLAAAATLASVETVPRLQTLRGALPTLTAELVMSIPVVDDRHAAISAVPTFPFIVRLPAPDALWVPPGIFFVSGAGGIQGATTDLVINKPPGVQVGDLLISFVFNNTSVANGGADPPLLSGWTNILTDSIDDATTFYCSVRAQYRIADGTEGASFTFSKGGAATGWAGSILAYRNVDPGNPIVSSGDTAAGNVSSATGIVAPSLTPTDLRSMLVCAFGLNLGGAAFSLDSTMVQRDLESNVAAASTSEISADELLATAGATGTKTTTWTGINRSVIGVSVVLSPIRARASFNFAAPRVPLPFVFRSTLAGEALPAIATMAISDNALFPVFLRQSTVRPSLTQEFHGSFPSPDASLIARPVVVQRAQMLGVSDTLATAQAAMLVEVTTRSFSPPVVRFVGPLDSWARAAPNIVATDEGRIVSARPWTLLRAASAESFQNAIPVVDDASRRSGVISAIPMRGSSEALAGVLPVADDRATPVRTVFASIAPRDAGAIATTTAILADESIRTSTRISPVTIARTAGEVLTPAFTLVLAESTPRIVPTSIRIVPASITGEPGIAGVIPVSDERISIGSVRGSFRAVLDLGALAVPNIVATDEGRIASSRTWPVFRAAAADPLAGALPVVDDGSRRSVPVVSPVPRGSSDVFMQTATIVVSDDASRTGARTWPVRFAAGAESLVGVIPIADDPARRTSTSLIVRAVAAVGDALSSAISVSDESVRGRPSVFPVPVSRESVAGFTPIVLTDEASRRSPFTMQVRVAVGNEALAGAMLVSDERVARTVQTQTVLAKPGSAEIVSAIPVADDRASRTTGVSVRAAVAGGDVFTSLVMPVTTDPAPRVTQMLRPMPFSGAGEFFGVQVVPVDQPRVTVQAIRPTPFGGSSEFFGTMPIAIDQPRVIVQPIIVPKPVPTAQEFRPTPALTIDDATIDWLRPGRGVLALPYQFVSQRPATIEVRPTPAVMTDDVRPLWHIPGRGVLAVPYRWVDQRPSTIEVRPTPAISVPDERAQIRAWPLPFKPEVPVAETVQAMMPLADDQSRRGVPVSVRPQIVPDITTTAIPVADDRSPKTVPVRSVVISMQGEGFGGAIPVSDEPVRRSVGVTRQFVTSAPDVFVGTTTTTGAAESVRSIPIVQSAPRGPQSDAPAVSAIPIIAEQSRPMQAVALIRLPIGQDVAISVLPLFADAPRPQAVMMRLPIKSSPEAIQQAVLGSIPDAAVQIKSFSLRVPAPPPSTGSDVQFVSLPIPVDDAKRPAYLRAVTIFVRELRPIGESQSYVTDVEMVIFANEASAQAAFAQEVAGMPQLGVEAASQAQQTSEQDAEGGFANETAGQPGFTNEDTDQSG